MSIYRMRKFDESTHKNSGWIKDCILLIYIFMMLIFKNEFVVRFGEGKFYLLIFIGGLSVLLGHRIIIGILSKSESKKIK